MKNINRLTLIFMVLGGFVLESETINAQTVKVPFIHTFPIEEFGKIKKFGIEIETFIRTDDIKVFTGSISQKTKELYESNPSSAKFVPKISGNAGQECICRNFRNQDFRISIHYKSDSNNFWMEIGTGYLRGLIIGCIADAGWTRTDNIDEFRKRYIYPGKDWGIWNLGGDAPSIKYVEENLDILIDGSKGRVAAIPKVSDYRVN